MRTLECINEMVSSVLTLLRRGSHMASRSRAKTTRSLGESHWPSNLSLSLSSSLQFHGFRSLRGGLLDRVDSRKQSRFWPIAKVRKSRIPIFRPSLKRSSSLLRTRRSMPFESEIWSEAESGLMTLAHFAGSCLEWERRRCNSFPVRSHAVDPRGCFSAHSQANRPFAHYRNQCHIVLSTHRPDQLGWFR